MSEHGHDDHTHDDGHAHDHGGNQRALAVALAINTVFFVVELAGALYANSLTLLADAAHMLTDSGSLALALLAAYLATRAADRRRTYGYQRVEILGALANGVALVAIVVYVAYEAFARYGDPQPVKAVPTILVGALGLAANLAGAYVLHGGQENLNVKGAYLHLLADAAGSVAAIALGVALYFTDLYVLDVLFSLCIAGLVLYSAKDLLRESLNILLQGAPSDVAVEDVAGTLAAIDGVRDVHDVHVWALASEQYACSAHVVVEADADRDAVLERARHALGAEHGVGHATIQVETEAGDCETADFDCYAPGDD
ncbi:cation transporter [Halarchaeum grantii]|uniref:Cation transporter n=1 Tax=Halarchaeum grantii TaxID=1193105 RepID=A0A830EVW0_9EURY|nr:cation diffusion facilitator family transporter [Halarchaeum grantii]GGL34894.1 cation transporter [Halarchaeum grantii]